MFCLYLVAVRLNNSTVCWIKAAIHFGHQFVLTIKYDKPWFKKFSSVKICVLITRKCGIWIINSVNICHLHRNFHFFMKSPVIIFNSCLSESAASSLNSTRNSVTRQILCWGAVVNVIGLALKFTMRFQPVIVKVFPIQAGEK